MDALEQQRLKRILSDTRNIALVGASNRPERASYQVMEYLQQQGYRVYPVNPQLAGAVILGETCVSGLEDLDQPVQLVNVFRRGEFAADIALDAIEHEALCLWLQEGVISQAAAEAAAEAELEYVEDCCIKVAHRALLG
ncbi:CoA-binding protein [Oceanimonas pelagia]|uniref:CoA-binding protein n=1 Tax=Oceanimonas pelagia TaxID=3028314 RepID=A0AA50QC44_9GAMM|nr:CoA-binding protein [Oceanimonas pelagia]WMC10897.1 CoA-binding protein [Oceanimonas pelagia]